MGLENHPIRSAEQGGNLPDSWIENQYGKLADLDGYKIKHGLDRRAVDFTFDQHGQIIAKLISPRGSVLEILLHSGAPVSFKTNDGYQVTYLNRHSQCPNGGNFNPEMPPRGGLFDCLPEFGPTAPGGAHGFGRYSDWRVKSTSFGSMRDSSVSIVLELTPAMLPGHLKQMNSWENADFCFRKIHTFTDNQLATRLHIINSGKSDLTVRPCFHDYYATSDARQVFLQGIGGGYFSDMIGKSGLDFQAPRIDDNPVTGIHHGERQSLISDTGGGELERIYHNTSDKFEIRNLADKRSIIVSKSKSLNDLVAWNPGIVKGNNMPDFDNSTNEYLKMVCVEPLAGTAIQIRAEGGEADFWRTITVKSLI